MEGSTQKEKKKVGRRAWKQESKEGQSRVRGVGKEEQGEGGLAVKGRKEALNARGKDQRTGTTAG